MQNINSIHTSKICQSQALPSIDNPFSHITHMICSSERVLLVYNMCQKISADAHIYNMSADPLVY